MRPSIDGRVRVAVEQQFGFLSWAHAADLGFLEVGLDPDVLERLTSIASSRGETLDQLVGELLLAAVEELEQGE
jgi:hypothetical protein